ncbi:MAG: type II secretion system protein M [Xanthomonadales bacterium]|nr:type II secretion system protein M [Xanthomonadales bacterium]
MNVLKSRWSGLQAREQQVLRIGAVILGLLLIYLLIVDPVYSGRKNAEQRLQATREAVSVMQGQAADLMASTATSQAQGSGSLLTRIESSAEKQGLRNALRRLQPSGNDQMQVSLEGASYTQLIQWLGDLDQQGIRAIRADIQLDSQSDLLEVQLLLVR